MNKMIAITKTQPGNILMKKQKQKKKKKKKC